MKKAILSVAIFFFFIDMGLARAAMISRSINFYYEPNGLATATGTVEAVGLNSIEIYDEIEKRQERFVYLGQSGEFRKGDYIRIYYHPKGAIIQRVKRMTILKYKMDGQNLGYISR